LRNSGLAKTITITEGREMFADYLTYIFPMGYDNHVKKKEEDIT
jgi:hypothetical protein